MFCKYCGNKINNNVRFCPNCGKQIFESAPPAPPVKPESEMKTQNPAEKPKKKHHAVLIFLVLILLGVCGIGFFIGARLVKTMEGSTQVEEKEVDLKEAAKEDDDLKTEIDAAAGIKNNDNGNVQGKNYSQEPTKPAVSEAESSDKAVLKGLPASGTYGNNISWRISLDGVLVIDGAGEIEDSSSTAWIWNGADANDIVSVVINEGVTGIGEFVFESCSSLCSVKLPKSLISIKRQNFSECTGLSDVYYAGSREQWDAIVVSRYGNICLTEASVYYTSEIEAGLETAETNMEGYDGNIIDSTGYILPESDSRYITESELEGFDQKLCRLARNEIYARHGRKFDDQELQAYFNQFDWYLPVIEPGNFSESMLNAYEIANRNLIVEYEEAHGFR